MANLNQLSPADEAKFDVMMGSAADQATQHVGEGAVSGVVAPVLATNPERAAVRPDSGLPKSQSAIDARADQERVAKLRDLNTRFGRL